MPLEGETFEVTAEWKRDRVAEMKKHRISKAEMARRLNVSRGAISQLFKSSQRSTLVPRVDRVLRAAGATLGNAGGARLLSTEMEANAEFIEALIKNPDDTGLEARWHLLVPDVQMSVWKNVAGELGKWQTALHEAEMALIEAKQRRTSAQFALNILDRAVRRLDEYSSKGRK